MEKLIQRGMLLCAFAMPITISVAEPLAFVLLALWLFMCIKTGCRPCHCLSQPFFMLVVLFSVIGLISSIIGLHPAHSVQKCHRFILFGLIFLVPTFFSFGGKDRNDPKDGRMFGGYLLLAFILGTSVLAIFDIFRVPIQISGGMKYDHTGNMRDPQLYMVALLFNLSLMGSDSWRKKQSLMLVCLVLSGIGVVIHFKRGVWFSAILTICLLALLKKQRKIIFALVLVVVLALCFPQVREKLRKIVDEAFKKSTGARVALWTEVAPVLIKEHPFGVGFKGTTHQDLLETTDHYIQPGLDHVHNNLLQVAIETGWLGLFVWLIWMGKVLWIQFRRVFFKGETQLWMLACFISFLGLMLNGIVEYNFGDTEVMMVMVFIIGITSSLIPRQADPPAS